MVIVTNTSSNKAGYTDTRIHGYTDTLVACRWAGAVLEKLSRASGQEQYAQKAQKAEKVKGDRQTNQPTDRRSNGRVFLYRHSTSELVFS